jgi:hypothetical protein
MKWLPLILVSGCGLLHVDHPIMPEVACSNACARLAELGCESAKPTPEGTTCEQICYDTEASGFSTMHPKCVAEATSCEDADHVSAHGCAP